MKRIILLSIFGIVIIATSLGYFYISYAAEPAGHSNLEKNARKSQSGMIDNPSPTNSKIQKVIVTGLGSDPNKARQAASRSAIQQVVGMYISSEQLMKNKDIIKDQVLSASNAFVNSFKVLNEIKNDDGLYEVTAEVEVEALKLEDKMREAKLIEIKIDDSIKQQFSTKANLKEDFLQLAIGVVVDPIITSLFEVKVLKVAAVKNITKRSSDWGSFNLDGVPYDFKWSSNKIEEKFKKVLNGDMFVVRIDYTFSLSPQYFDSIEKMLKKGAPLSNADKPQYTFVMAKIKNSKYFPPTNTLSFDRDIFPNSGQYLKDKNVEAFDRITTYKIDYKMSDFSKSILDKLKKINFDFIAYDENKNVICVPPSVSGVPLKKGKGGDYGAPDDLIKLVTFSSILPGTDFLYIAINPNPQVAFLFFNKNEIDSIDTVSLVSK